MTDDDKATLRRETGFDFLSIFEEQMHKAVACTFSRLKTYPVPSYHHIVAFYSMQFFTQLIAPRLFFLTTRRSMDNYMMELYKKQDLLQNPALEKVLRIADIQPGISQQVTSSVRRALGEIQDELLRWERYA